MIGELNPNVTIILVNYNSSQDTIECVQSLKRCLYDNYKIIVVDNNSNLKEKEILREIETEVELIYSNTNTGFAGGNNIGIKKALNGDSDYVMLLNNDTIVEPDFLKPLIETAESDEKIGVVGGKILFYDNKNYIWYNGGKINKFKGNVVHFENKKKDGYQRNEYIECSFITGCLQLIKCDVLKSVGLLSENYFLYFEDADYCSKVIQAGWKLVVNSKSVIYHKVSKSTIENSDNYLYYFSRNRLLFIKDNYKLINKIFAYGYTIISLLYKYIKYKNCSVLNGIKDYFFKRYGIRHMEA